MKRIFFSAAVVIAAILTSVNANAQEGFPPMFTTPFFVTQTFTRENGKWWMTAMVFTTRTTGPGIDSIAPLAH